MEAPLCDVCNTYDDTGRRIHVEFRDAAGVLWESRDITLCGGHAAILCTNGKVVVRKRIDDLVDQMQKADEVS